MAKKAPTQSVVGQSQKIYNSLFDSIEINNSIVQLNARHLGGNSGVVGRNGIKRNKQFLSSHAKQIDDGGVSKSMNVHPFKTHQADESHMHSHNVVAMGSRNAVNRSFQYDSHNNSIQNNPPITNNLVGGVVGGSFLNQSYEYPTGLATGNYPYSLPTNGVPANPGSNAS